MLGFAKGGAGVKGMDVGGGLAMRLGGALKTFGA